MSKKFTLHAGDARRPNVLANLLSFLGSLPESKSWRVEIREARKERTLDQNAAMFGVAYAKIMEATGLEGDADRKQLHRDFCGDFFGWTTGPLGHRKPVRTTTTNEHGERDVIDTATMKRMYDFIQRQAAKYDIQVPDPDPMWRARLAA